ncbi:hypothetical protein HNR23_001313 [Nocardiopsis mwathae]|uniref:Intein C-terminal splicing domain-containing protein n=1 Tax=Nocardiopsis mwathae TaxID=1472723 RepID=A0A7W9YFJ6_9ACTN|nr:polymorphic toxin-type HINT domain-containing protein [Nocardiopsis mwathae]MBB6171253.1 hypothetical protein [Nocardiopsis mwathae]
MIEYAAVILLVAAIVSVVMDAGIGDRVAAEIERALKGVSGEETAAGHDPTELAGDDIDPGGTADHGAETTGLPGDATTREYSRTHSTDFPVDEDGEPLILAPGDEVTPKGLGEVDEDDPPVQRFLDALADGAGNDVGGVIEGIGELLTDPVGSLGDSWDAIAEDPLGLILSQELRDAWDRGDWPAAFGYGVWDIGSSLVGGVGLLLKGGKAATKTPQGGGSKPPDGNGSDKDSGQKSDKEDSSNDEKKNEDNRAAGCKTGNSFLPGTPVLLADGTSAPIEDIAVGSDVWAFDPLTGEEGPRSVTATITGSGEKTLVEITIADDNGDTGSVTATDEHPFWAPEKGKWVDAIDLDPGTWLRSSNGTWVQVTAVQTSRASDQNVHNFTVDGISTYYVAAPGMDILVHNNDCPPPMLDDQSEKYVRDKHMPGGPLVTPDKSLFRSDVDLDALVEAAESTPARGPNRNGNYERDVTASEIIGNKSQNAGGDPTRRYRVVQDKWGGVITMHPL